MEKLDAAAVWKERCKRGRKKEIIERVDKRSLSRLASLRLF